MNCFAYGYKTRLKAEIALNAAMEESQICNGTKPIIRAYKAQSGKVLFAIYEESSK